MAKKRQQSKLKDKKVNPPKDTSKESSTPNLAGKIANALIGKSQEINKVEGAEGKREGTRSMISKYYILGYFAVIGAVLFLSDKNFFDLSGYKDMLLTVSGILSGPLGFIIGYYFKSEGKN